MATLNTRIRLKYDSLTNWQTNKPVLLAGEIAIVTTGEMKDGSTHSNAQYPVLFKVGDGESTWEQLPFASALAADVYSWAKASDVVLSGKTIQFKTDDKVYKSVVLNYITEAEANTLISNALAAYSTTEEINETLKDYKTKQTAYSAAGTTSKTVINVAQNENGELTVTYGDINFPEVNTGVMDVTGTSAIAVGVPGEDDSVLEVSLVIDEGDAGNVELTQTENGLKANIDLSEYATKNELSGLENGQVKTNKEAIEAINNTTTGILAQAKKYADDNDADTKYGIEYDSNTKKIKLTSDTSKTEIDATAFIKDGMITSVELNDNNKLVITWNTDSDKGEDSVTEIPLSGLIDVYTGVDGTTVKVEVSSDNKISAEVKDGSIVKTKLDSAVQTSLGLADSAVQEADLGTMAKANTTDYLTKAQIEAGYQPAGDYKTIQATVSSPTASGNTLAFIDTISQNANGVITATKKNVDLSNYATKAELPTVGNGKFTVSGTGSLIGSGSMTANQADDTTASLDIANKGVTTAKLADGAVGAAQTKASSTYTGSDKEVWIFNCGSSSVNV